jgi:beta-glucuronidase
VARLAALELPPDDRDRLPDGDRCVTEQHDPFAHLHDEAYADPYQAARVGHAQLVTVAGRARISLDGDWHFTPDLFDEGLRQRWFADPPIPPAQWDKPRDHDPDAAEMLAVPSCWTMARPEWRFFEGAGWYARSFDWDGSAERLVLRVGAANYQALVFLNGIFLAAHRGGSTPFCVELTAHLANGANRLTIQVDNRRRADRVPMHHFDWFNHAGLYREVDLLPLPAVFIQTFYAGLTRSGRIEVSIALSDRVDGTARVMIAELGIAADLPVAGGHARAEIEAMPERWCLEAPRRYTVQAAFEGDTITDHIGFRDIRVQGHDILLNGRPIYLRGVCVHEDDAILGKTTSDDDIRRRFIHARELGCNFLRLAHYPHHERVAEIADEVGLLLWAEIPVYWAIDFANPDTYADAENQLLELIARDRNRASVIIWGVGNENADTNARASFMSRLADAARRADPTRLVSAACLINRSTFTIEDRLASHLDIIGLNEYFGWYEPDFTGLERLLANSKPDRPVVISEVGADALAGHRGGKRELFTEDCQADIYRQQLAIIAQAPWLRGFCPWLLYDFRSARRQTRFQRGFNRKGLIAEDKTTKKLAFSVIAEHYERLAAEDRASGQTDANQHPSAATENGPGARADRRCDPPP